MRARHRRAWTHWAAAALILYFPTRLQWILEHRTLLPALMRQLRPGGVLAVQIPVQQSQPMHRIIAETARRGKMADGLSRAAPRVPQSSAE